MRQLIMSKLAILFITYSCVIRAHGIVHEQITQISREIVSQDTAQNRIERAQLYRMDGQWMPASQDFLRARELNSENNRIDFLEAAMWHDAGKPGLALPLVNRLLKNQGNHINGLWLRARILSALGDTAQALDDYRQIASSAERMLPEMYLEWAHTQAALAPTNLSAVNQIIQQGVTQLGPLASLLQYAIHFNRDHHAYQSALDWLNMLPEQLQIQPHWVLQRADLLGLTEQHMEARVKRQQALELLLARQKSGTLSPAQHQLLSSLMQE
ncbi:MAG: hypothetical protein K0U68_14885 [Gammaproteobacteria bacterium]|nr:hypothetical protein [Gammaproteobacteria bacterium]